MHGVIGYATHPDRDFRSRTVHRPFHPAVFGYDQRAILRGCLRHAGAERVEPRSNDDQLIRLDPQGVIDRTAVHGVDKGKHEFFTWLRAGGPAYDVVVIDFPDPNSFALGKLYTTTFYATLAQRLHDRSVVVVQSTSPYVATGSYWCIHNTLAASGYAVVPYHVYVPSFGDWGFFLASRSALRTMPLDPTVQRRFLDDRTFAEARHFPPDIAWRSTELNRLNNQALVRLFEEEWDRVGQ